MIYFFLSKISWQEYNAGQISYYDSRKTEVNLKNLQRSHLWWHLSVLSSEVLAHVIFFLFIHYFIFPLRCQVAGESDGVAWKYLMSPFTAFQCMTQDSQVKTSYFPFDIHQLLMLQVSGPTNLLQRYFTSSKRLWASHWRSDGAVVSAHLVLIWLSAGYVHAGQLCNVHY